MSLDRKMKQSLDSYLPQKNVDDRIANDPKEERWKGGSKYTLFISYPHSLLLYLPNSVVYVYARVFLIFSKTKQLVIPTWNNAEKIKKMLIICPSTLMGGNQLSLFHNISLPNSQPSVLF